MLGLKFAVFVRSTAEMARRCPTWGPKQPAGSSNTSTHKSPTNDAVVTTAGCIFPDGIIDLVASEDPCRPNLLFWDGDRAKIAPRIRHGDLWYQAPELHPSVGRIMRLPDRVCRSGSASQLFAEVSALFQQY